MEEIERFIRVLENFIAAKVQDMESTAIEDAVNLNNARDDLARFLAEQAGVG